MRFVLLDLSQGATCADGTSLSAALLAAMAEAYTKQLNTHYSAEYGGNFSFRMGADQADLQDGEYPFVFLPSFADAPGAIAYHNTNGNGLPMLFDAVTASNTVNGEGNSCTVAGSHESLETALDPGCSLYAADGTGTIKAYEASDAFENQTYPISTSFGMVWVSNFALRAFWTPGSVGPYSYMAANGYSVVDAPQPLVTPAGQGYQLQMVYDPSSAQAVQGFRVERVGSIELARRRDIVAGSRKHRRGVPLAA